jgi:hypothetical protein
MSIAGSGGSCADERGICPPAYVSAEHEQRRVAELPSSATGAIVSGFAILGLVDGRFGVGALLLLATGGVNFKFWIAPPGHVLETRVPHRKKNQKWRTPEIASP